MCKGPKLRFEYALVRGVFYLICAVTSPLYTFVSLKEMYHKVPPFAPKQGKEELEFGCCLGWFLETSLVCCCCVTMPYFFYMELVLSCCFVVNQMKSWLWSIQNDKPMNNATGWGLSTRHLFTGIANLQISSWRNSYEGKCYPEF